VWIRFLECLLHISYCLEIKKWQARGEDDQQESQDKKKIQNLFNNEIGILANNVMPGGSGTSNVGNTAGGFLTIIDNLLEFLVSTKILSSYFM
jgi:hypothetical protein